MNVKLFLLHHFHPFCIITTRYIVFICIMAEPNDMDKNEYTDGSPFP